MSYPEFGVSRGNGNGGIEWIRWSSDAEIIRFKSPGTFAIRIRQGDPLNDHQSPTQFGPWHLAWGDNGMTEARFEQQVEYTQKIEEARRKTNSG